MLLTIEYQDRHYLRISTYDGAIDDRPTPDAADIRGADNYVSDALTEAMAGKPVAKPFTHPYGCSVKYSE
jgi:hypothetical protein